MTKQDILKSYIKFQVKQLLSERQEPQELDPNRIGKVDQYTKALPLLDKSLQALMSKKYRHFVKDIQIISAKPSTFKVILNNDYFVYLTYNHGSITADIEGKSYSLIVNQDVQRAAKSVTELLKFSSPTLDKNEGADAEGAGGIDSYEGSGNVPMPSGDGGVGSGADTDLGPENGAPVSDTGVSGTDYDADFDSEIDNIVNAK